MGSSDAEVIVAAVALIISVIALSATFMQVLQQYYASASGYSECNEKVMGQWASTKSRTFSWHELRFEVTFEAPVIFVAPPGNTHGPIKERPIIVLDGTEESMMASWTTANADGRPTSREKIHTADNERATWHILLSAIQRMESESCAWQEGQYRNSGPPESKANHYSIPKAAPTLHQGHTLAVSLQRKRRSWDTMPRSVAKPYATTTICHLIEMMAALGIYWKEFDRRRDRYRAEGNGFSVLGERVSDLGLCFSFQTYGKSGFGANRVIPVDEIKELCFGYVPTIFRATLDQRRLESPNDEPKNLSSLQMASRSEVAQTLVLIGCNNDTVRYFLEFPYGNTTHLFPVSFEILGMLSRTFHIDDTCFTYIPNPTPDRWDKRSFSLLKLIEAFQRYFNVKPRANAPKRNSEIARTINLRIREIIQYYSDEGSLDRLKYFKALRRAVENADEVLTARATSVEETEKTAHGSLTSDQQSQTANKRTKEGSETIRQTQRREMVQDVLRSHFQEVLRLLNESDRSADLEPVALLVPPEQTLSSGAQRFPDVIRPRKAPRFKDMNAASPDERQHKFMRVYFEVVAPKVTRSAKRSFKHRRDSVSSRDAAAHAHRRRSVEQSSPIGSQLVPRDTSPVPSIAIRSMSDDFEGAPARRSVDVLPQLSSPASSPRHSIGEAASLKSSNNEDAVERSLAAEQVSHEDIWCTLVFRMICWLMLHDFNKLDVQLDKSELLGSRMPVYIS